MWLFCNENAGIMKLWKLRILCAEIGDLGGERAAHKYAVLADYASNNAMA